MKGSAKSKKERLKSLSLVGWTNWSPDEMRTVVCSNNDDGPNGNTTRLKLSKKSLNGCKVAGKAAVPRKLRTATKQRSCKSPSPILTVLKKPDTSTFEDRPPKQNGVKKFKKDAAVNWSPRKFPCGFMTKDEEEVAEILFSMASMFPDKEASHDTGCRHYSAQSNKSIFSEAKECLIPVLGGNRMKSDLGAHSMTNEVVSTSVNEGKHGEETKDGMTSYEYLIHRIDLPDRHICEDSYQCREPRPRVLSSRDTSNSKMPISCSVGFSSESCIGFGSQQPKTRVQALNQETPESPDGLASCRGSELQNPGIFKGIANMDYHTLSHGVSMGSNENNNPQLLRPSKKPARIDATVPYRKPISRVPSHSTVSKYTVDKIPWKRCATHVWIGYLIQELKGGVNMESASMPQMHMKLKMNTDKELRMQTSLHHLRTCSSRAVSIAKLIEVKHKPTRSEVQNQIPFLETLKEKSLQNLCSVVQKPENQVFDFLSLSDRDSGIDANTSKDRTRVGNRSHMGSYLSLGPSNTPGVIHAIPTQNNYYSPAYGNQSTSIGLQQVGQQIPMHVGSCSTNLPQKGPCILTKEQRPQILWGSMAYPQGLQAANPDHPTRILCSAPMVPFSPNTHFPKYAMMVPHHQQQLASLPRPPALFSGPKTLQDHCLPAGDQFYTGALPLQLLCNERL